MAAVVLRARLRWEEGRCIAAVDGLALESEGETVAEAQNGLINLLRNWIEVQDSSGSLEDTLAQAGVAGAEETSKLLLEFVE